MSSSFQHSPNKQAFSHLESACFADRVKLQWLCTVLCCEGPLCMPACQRASPCNPCLCDCHPVGLAFPCSALQILEPPTQPPQGRWTTCRFWDSENIRMGSTRGQIRCPAALTLGSTSVQQTRAQDPVGTGVLQRFWSPQGSSHKPGSQAVLINYTFISFLEGYGTQDDGKECSGLSETLGFILGNSRNFFRG